MSPTPTLEDVQLDIKSLLNSSPRPLTAIDIERDYKAITGFDKIPFWVLGFSNIHDFLKTVPLIKLSFRGGETVYECIASEKTKHLTDLVKGQKVSKKRSSKGAKSKSARFMGGGGRSRPPRSGNSFRQPPPPQRDQYAPRRLNPSTSWKQESTLSDTRFRGTTVDRLDSRDRYERYSENTNRNTEQYDRRRSDDDKHAERRVHHSDEYYKDRNERKRNSWDEDCYIGPEGYCKKDDNNKRDVAERKSEINRGNQSTNKYHYYQSEARTYLDDDRKENGTNRRERYDRNGHDETRNKRSDISKETNNQGDYGKTKNKYHYYQSETAVKEIEDPPQDTRRDNNSSGRIASDKWKETNRRDDYENSNKYNYYQSGRGDEKIDDRYESNLDSSDEYFDYSGHNAINRFSNKHRNRGMDNSTIDHNKNLNEQEFISITLKNDKTESSSRKVQMDKEVRKFRRKVSETSSYDKSFENSLEKVNDKGSSTGVFKRTPRKFLEAGHVTEEFTSNNISYGPFWNNDSINYNLDTNAHFNVPSLEVPYNTAPMVSCPPYTVFDAPTTTNYTTPSVSNLSNENYALYDGVDELSNAGIILPVMLDSGLRITFNNNIATSEVEYNGPTTQFEYQSKLLEYTRSINIPDPTYVNRKPGRPSSFYHCYVVVNGEKFCNINIESRTIEDAKEVAAKEAYETMIERRKHIQLPETKNVREVIRRVKEIVSNHQRGLWNSQIEIDYKSKYNESLPKDWITQLMNNPLISVESVQQGKWIVYPQSVIFPSVATTSLPVITLPYASEWNVFITTCNSTSSIWFRLIGPDFEDKYAALADQMDDLYLDMEEGIKTSGLVVGGYYAASNGEACWRVKIMALNAKSATCFLIDHGDTDEFSLDKIYPLHKRFTELAPQAVECCLTGLDGCENSQNLLDALSEDILGRALVAKLDPKASKISLTLYNTSSEEDVNVNDKIAQLMKLEDIPKLSQVDQRADCVIRTIDEYGNAVVNLKSEGLELLVELLSQAEDILSTNLNKSSCDIVVDQVYITKSNQTQSWIRVKIDNITDRNLIDVSLIDYDTTSIVQKSDLFDCALVSEYIGFIPPQAIHVKLHEITKDMLTNGGKKHLRDILPEGKDGFLKVMRFEELPVVEIFHREERNVLKSVNKEIIELTNRRLVNVENKSEQTQEDLVEILEIGMKSIGITDFATSVKRRSFSIGNIMLVEVAMSANPDNFTMIEPRSRRLLENLTKEMNESYSNSENIPRVESENICIGRAFAYKGQQDDYWRRVAVFKTTGIKNVVSVELLDFGNIISANINEMLWLLPKFAKLEAQAIKGKLAGVEPMHGDWTVEDVIQFRALTEKRKFSCFVKSVDELNQRICVNLVDCNTNLCINDLLTSQRRAKEIS